VPWRGPFIRAKAVGIGRRFTGFLPRRQCESVEAPFGRPPAPPKAGRQRRSGDMLHLPLRAASARREFVADHIST